MVIKRALNNPIILSNIFYHATLIVGTVVTSRLYRPDEFGAFGSVVALIQLFGLASAFRLDTAVVIPRSNPMARAILCVGLTSVTFVAISIAIGLATIHFLSSVTTSETLYVYIPIGIILVGAQQLQLQLALRLERFSLAAVALIVHALAMIGTQVLFGTLHWDARGLIFGHLAGYICANTVYLSTGMLGNFLRPLPSLPRLLVAVRSYFSFAALGSATTVFSSLGTYFPVLMLGQLVSQEAAGLYLIASRVTTAPIDFVGTGISQTLVGKIASRNRKNIDSRRELRKLLRVMSALGIASILLIGSLAPLYIEHLLGAEWASAATFVSFLSVGAAAQFVAVPFSALFAVYRDQKAAFYQIASLTLVRLLLFSAGIFVGGATLAVAGFAAASWIGYTFLLRKFLSVSQVGSEFLLTYVLEFLVQIALFSIVIFLLHSKSDTALPAVVAVSLAVLSVLAQLFRVRKILLGE
jgi:O-antigen/teichoic acid export membrane protein